MSGAVPGGEALRRLSLLPTEGIVMTPRRIDRWFRRSGFIRPLGWMPALVLTLAAARFAAADPNAAATPASVATRVAAPASTTATVTGVRSYTGPTATRVVVEFSRPVAHVAPDSGLANRVMMSVPGEPVALGNGLATRIGVNDGVVDSVVVTAGPDGARFTAWLHDTTTFAVFSLPAQDDKPYRLVLDVTKRGGEAALVQKLAVVAAKKKKERLHLVVVDPGHGGEDAGARGPGGAIEKSVTLAVGKQLVTQLNAIPGIRAVLTRDGDYFIPLRDRYRIAERAKADLFVSVHCNSSRRRGRGSGTEVYFLSLHGADDQASRDLADAENAADLVGGVPAQSEDDLVNILYDVKRTGVLQQSQLLAETLLDQIAGDRLESRGVKQAGFLVLKSVEFPSVLVETAFINNPVEARLLTSRSFQEQLGRQLAGGVKSYFEKAGVELSVPAEP